MAQNIQIDPVKKDYVVVNGSPVESETILENCYYAILVPLNNWLYGQIGQGSLVYTLENVKRDTSLEQHYASYVNDAVKRQVITPGLATAVETINIQATRDGSSNQTNVVPSQQQLSNQLNFVSV